MKKREELLKRAYQKVIEVGLGNRSIDDLASFVEQDIMGYGTALDEKILSMADFIDLVQLQRKQSVNFDDFYFTSNLVLTRLTDNDNTGIVVDEIELVTKIGNDTNKLNLRMTAVFEFKVDSWKLLHWHSSKPEHVSDGQDPWHVDEWKKKTEKLERMVDEKTAELIKKNEELEVEASLERVRAVAMGMAKSEDLLNICEASYKEFRKLGFDTLRNAVIHIPNDEQKYFMDYDYSEFTGGDIAKIEYGSHPIVDEYLEKIRSAADAYFEVVINKDQLSDWKEFRKNSGQSDDSRLDEAEALYYYLFSIGIGDIGISTFKPINKSQIKILKRFRNVFDLAYKRYNDIAFAESQAREAQIEAALERIRAHAMGLRKSEELNVIISIIFEELKKLGLPVYECSIFIRNGKSRDFTCWNLGECMKLAKSYNFPFFSHPILDKVLDSIEQKVSLHEFIIDNKELRGYCELMFEQTDFKDAPKEYKDSIVLLDRLHVAQAIMNHGFLEIIGTEPLSGELCGVLKRFTNVVDLTYTRYLDLQNAEAQARESEIELALERVRARTMAMQHSDELAEASFLLDSQVRALGIKTRGCAFNIYGENESTEWFSSEMGTLPVYQTPRENIFLRYFEEGQKGVPMYIESFEGPACATHYDYLCTLPIMGEALTKFKEEGGSFPNKQIDHVTYFKYGYLLFITLEPVPDAHDIFKRFAKVFEQTYTRFLDLKKAEAQAREAQIEAGLERARAQSMMMQHSEELNKTSQVFHEQLYLLGIESEFSYLWLPDEVKMEHLFWATWQEGADGFKNKQVIYPLDKSEPAIAECYVAWESGMSVHVNPVPATGVEEYFNTWTELLEGVDKFKPELYPDGLYYVDAYMKYGCFGIMIRKQLSEDEQQVLHRFSREFERAYTRFLDLKKTEAQARESQIELSLERIRAQVTAMKESVDLLDIVVTMRTEFVNLGHEAHYFWHMRYLPNKYEKAMTSGDGTRIGMVMTLPRHIHGDIKLIDDWEKSDEPTVVFAMDVETAVDYVDKMISLGDFQQVDPNAPTLDDIRHIGGLTFVMARTSHGEIGYSLPGVVSDPPAEDLAILFRFAGVFDLAYKRFEDLKISEQRNREARIELALERVRARTMAMQKSNELAQTAAHLFSQLNELGIKPYRCNIAIVDEDLKNCRLWSTTNSGNVIPTGSALPLNEHPILQETYDGWKSQRTNHVIKLIGKLRLEWAKYISKYLPFDEYKKNKINEDQLLKEEAFFSNFYFKQGFFTIHSKEELNKDQMKIIQRFAYVFEQTYTRFQDLENAEKQNKIIQAENERKTEELEEARQLQLAMLPKEVPQLSNLDIAVFMKTATEVGGDYYDFHVDSKNNLTAIIGDATGHGMKAGTMVTITKSLFNSLASSRDILKTFKRISEVIKNMKFRQLSMCLQMIKINGSEFSISSAAMPPAFIYHYVEDSVEEILLSGMPLGAMMNYQYKIEKRKLMSGDVIFLLSDGLPELHNHKKHMYGYDRVKTELIKVGKKSPQKIVEHFEQSANEWLNGYEQDDDVTFVVIKIK